MAKDKAAQTESQTYQKMYHQVEQLVQDLNQGDLDLDALVQKVEHGYQLIQAMRERLDETKQKIDKLRADFQESGTSKD